MDIATVSIIATASIGLMTVGGTIWNSLQPARVAREGRIEQRRADAYLEILRLAEQESLYYTARMTNLLIAAIEDQAGLESRIEVPEPPPVESRASLAAHVAGFASADVANAYRTWRTRMDEVRGAHEDIAFHWRENVAPYEVVELEMLQPMRDIRLPAEKQARIAMADQIAAELRHRRPKRLERRKT
ncbi:hypothetical protein [Pseudonocardia sp. T1-2H]|uniref:hypothetical protein n=1 Tax=Pseudonocardia sp. T1-2H TaxID=3128899 RepID=UPI0031018677